MENFTLKSVKQDNDTSLGTINNVILKSESTLPRKFTIPVLKSTKQQSGSPTFPTSNINQFILKQLEEQETSSTLNASRFNVPVLAKPSTGFTIPEFRNTKLQICRRLEQDGNQSKELNSERKNDETQTQDHIIDLTTALSCATISSSTSSSRNNGRNQSKKAELDSFEIPFIDCDRQQQFLQNDNYCLIDISNTRFQHNLAPSPSTLGRYFSSKTKRRVELPVKRAFKAKHQVQRFLFDTKSPDDLVLASLNRFTRTQ